MEITKQDLIDHRRGVPDSSCPRCNRKINHVASEKRILPSPGDLSICYYCAALLEFTSDLQVKLFSHVQLLLLKQKEPETFKELIDSQNEVKAMIK